MRLAGIQTASIPDAASFIVAHPPAGWEIGGDPNEWPERWATEIMPLAKEAFTRVQISRGMYSANAHGPPCFWPVTVSRDYTAGGNQQALTQPRTIDVPASEARDPPRYTHAARPISRAP